MSMTKRFTCSHENASVLVEDNSSRELGAMLQKHMPVVLPKTQSLAFSMTTGDVWWRSHHVSSAVWSLAWQCRAGKGIKASPLYSQLWCQLTHLHRDKFVMAMLFWDGIIQFWTILLWENILLGEPVQKLGFHRCHHGRKGCTCCKTSPCTYF